MSTKSTKKTHDFGSGRMGVQKPIFARYVLTRDAPCAQKWPQPPPGLPGGSKLPFLHGPRGVQGKSTQISERRRTENRAQSIENGEPITKSKEQRTKNNTESRKQFGRRAFRAFPRSAVCFAAPACVLVQGAASSGQRPGAASQKLPVVLRGF